MAWLLNEFGYYQNSTDEGFRWYLDERKSSGWVDPADEEYFSRLDPILVLDEDTMFCEDPVYFDDEIKASGVSEL